MKNKVYASLLFLMINLFFSFQTILAQKNIALNPSDQTGNAVCGGGNESDYATLLVNQTSSKLINLGYSVKIFYGINGTPNAVNTWNLQNGGAHALVSMHTNATKGSCLGTASGTLTVINKIHKASDIELASKVRSGIVSFLKLADNGNIIWINYQVSPPAEGNLGVLNGVLAPCCLEEALFHDNQTDAAILRSSTGQDKIANGVATGIDNYLKNSTTSAPSNDNPCDAGVPTLSVGTSCSFTQGTNVGATNSSVSNVTCDGTSNGDIWYKLIVPSSGDVTIETNAGTISDMGMAVYSGSCSSLSYIGCYANGSSYSPYMPKAVLTGLTPNSTLWIRLWEYNNNNFGTFSICATTTATVNRVLTVISPNGGETLNKGTNYTITWNSSNVTGNIQIDLYKGSINVLQLAAGASNTGSYSFTPPTSLTDGSDYRIGISGMSGSVSDFSNGYFTISTKATPKVTVTSPNGGETLNKGTNYTITWNSSDVTGNIQIDLYKGSTNVLQLAAGASNTGSYSFTPPISLTDGSDYRIGISVLNGTVSDFSDSYFTIAGTTSAPSNDNPCDAGVPTLSVGSSCSFTEGTNVGATNSSVSNVTCDGTSNGDIWYKLIVPSSGDVTIETNAGTISDMGMAVYSGSCSSLTYKNCYANGSSYSPYMPKAVLTGLTPNSTLWIRLWEYNNNNFGTFSICATTTATVNRVLTVISPNGGETLNKGTNYTITWNSSDVTGNIQIDLYKGSTNVLQLAASASNTGSYSFTPPISLTDGSDYRIAISALNGTVSDFSNSYFTINTVNTECLTPSAPATCTTSIGDPANGLEHWTNLSCDLVSEADGYSYEYSWDGLTWEINWFQNASPSITVNHSDNPNVPLYYRVRAYKCTPLQYSDYNYASPQPIYTACDEAAIPTVNGATLNSLNVTLNAETPIENPPYTTYSIYCNTTNQYIQTNGTLGMNEIFQTKSDWGTKAVTGLLSNTEYCFYAKAKNGNSDVRFNPANNSCAKTLQGSILYAPVALAASNISQTGFTASWNSSSSATGYRLDLALDNTFSNYVVGYSNKDVGNVVTLPIPGLKAGMTYYYRVKAYNSDRTSEFSNIIQVTLPSIDDASLTIGNISGAAGSTISIPVSATKFLDVVAFQFTIVYDKNKLDYVSCSNWAAGTNVSDVQVNPLISDGKITFVYNNSAINITAGKFFDINFTVKSNVTGTSLFSWSDTPTKKEMSNSKSQEIPGNYGNGTLTIVSGFNLSGQLVYENTAQTPLSNIPISLFNSNSQSAGTSTTDATGSFSFSGLSNGNYTLKPDVKVAWGGASAMDITSYKKHIGNVSTLSQIQVKSGDVNGSNSLTSMDLTIIKQRIGAQISSFTVGDWVYDPVTAIINGTNLVQNIKALCYGDANGSYTISSLKSFSNVFLANKDKISLLKNGELEIPFMLNKAVDKLSSVTLVINYPDELFDVKDIKMIDNNEDLYYSVKDGKIYVVYSTLNSLNLKEGDLLMTIRFSLKKDASQLTLIDNQMEFIGSGEFGDYDDKILDDVKLSYSTIDFNTFINESGKDEIKVYPNPATNVLTVTNVVDTRINILDMLGRSLLSIHCPSNSVDLNIRSLMPGTYTLKINKNNEIIYRKFTVVK